MLPRIFRRSIEATALIAVLLGTAVHSDETTASLDAALKTAKERHAPVLVDFYAPWCYSCYFMAKNVKNGPEWEKLEKKAVIIELDADAPDGAHWIKDWSVKGLPAYVVLDENGRELGRIPLERTRAQFYPEVDAIIARADTFETLEAKVVDAKPASLSAARDVMQSFYARGDAAAGLDWRAAQPPAVSTALDKDAVGKLWVSRLQLMKAAQAKDAAQCEAIAPKVLQSEAFASLGCNRAYEIDRILTCTESLPVENRKKLLAAQVPAMQALLKTRVFIKTPTCADARSEVETTAELSKALGDQASAAKTVDRAIEDATDRLGGADHLDLKRDRNMADNLRVYLDLAGRTESLDALYPELIKAYPDDYVYAYRFGTSLARRGEYDKALPLLEQAAPKAYGVNRLKVAQARAEVLVKLGRNTDAKQVVADALKANGPFFPELTDKLKSVVASN